MFLFQWTELMTWNMSTTASLVSPCLIPVYALCLHIFLSVLLLYIYLMCSPQRVECICQAFFINLLLELKSLSNKENVHCLYLMSWLGKWQNHISANCWTKYVKLPHLLRYLPECTFFFFNVVCILVKNPLI